MRSQLDLAAEHRAPDVYRRNQAPEALDAGVASPLDRLGQLGDSRVTEEPSQCVVAVEQLSLGCHPEDTNRHPVEQRGGSPLCPDQQLGRLPSLGGGRLELHPVLPHQSGQGAEDEERSEAGDHQGPGEELEERPPFLHHEDRPVDRYEGRSHPHTDTRAPVPAGQDHRDEAQEGGHDIVSDQLLERHVQQGIGDDGGHHDRGPIRQPSSRLVLRCFLHPHGDPQTSSIGTSTHRP